MLDDNDDNALDEWFNELGEILKSEPGSNGKEFGLSTRKGKRPYIPRGGLCLDTYLYIGS